MYLNNAIEDSKILTISFNQDSSCFAIGTETGFKIYQTYPFKGPYKRIMNGGIRAVEMLYKSNILVLLGGGEAPKFGKNRVVIWDEQENKIISELKFITPVITIKLKKDLLFIVCQKRIYLFDFNTYDIIDDFETCTNNNGLIAINNDPSFTVLAYPTDKNKISINNFKLKKKILIETQAESISVISLNYNGTLLAIANEKRTLISIYSCDNSSELKTFKRGRNKADYLYICFDKENKFMAVGSNKGTIHIFSLGGTFMQLKGDEKIKKDNEKIKKENEINESNINRIENNNNIINIKDTETLSEEILPQNYKTFFGWSQIEKGFAKVKIKAGKYVCSFLNNSLIVISHDNIYYQAEIDVKKGGVCKILQEIDLNKINK